VKGPHEEAPFIEVDLHDLSADLLDDLECLEEQGIGVKNAE